MGQSTGQIFWRRSVIFIIVFQKFVSKPYFDLNVFKQKVEVFIPPPQKNLYIRDRCITVAAVNM